MSPSPFGPHERAVSNLSNQMYNSVAACNCNCTAYTGLDWIVQNDTVVRPNVMLVCGEQPEKHLERPPALVIEVLSDSTAEKDVTVKRELYESQGIEHYLIVDTATKSICWLALQAKGQYEDVSAQIGPAGNFSVPLDNGCEIHFDRQAALGIG